MACFELCDSPVLTQNPDIWNFNGSLTFNERKLEFLKSLICHCVRYDSFFIQFDMRKKLASLGICVSPVLTQNEDNGNFHSSLTVNNGKVHVI